MNVGALKKPTMAARPRSPEGKQNVPRARSPIVKQGAQISGGVRPSLASAGMPAPPPSGRSPLQQSQPKRGSTSTVEEIKKIDMNREQRRRAAEEVRRSRQEEAELLGAQCGGRAPDIDFHKMIRNFRDQCPPARGHEPIDPNSNDGIVVCVRKRPMQSHEIMNRELDCVTALNPYAIVHERKFKVDGITKCLESHQFEFDRVFGEEDSTEHVYGKITQPLVPWVIEKGGRATLFAYGQTGSGKTHTMTGIQRLLAEEIFAGLGRYSATSAGASEPLSVSVSFFEIYGGRPFDLLNNRQRLETLEDSRNEVQISGLTERAVQSPEAMLQFIELGNSLRTTHATAINRDSSRSHAICSVSLKTDAGLVHGKWTLVDLAGSERAADSKSSIRQRRVEGAQINKSLLALKECIRAMGDPREAHVPFRVSKLTLVLRDAFVSRGFSKTVMIACISPGMMSADHSVNTLRYSDRLKDHPRATRPAWSEQRGDDSLGSSQRTGSALGNSRDARSPEPRDAARRRSPSPGGAHLVAGQNARLHARPVNTSTSRLPEDDLSPEEIAALEDSDELEDDISSVPVAWPVEADKVAPSEVPVASAVTEPSAGSRSGIPRQRGRQPQPTVQPAVMVPTRPVAVGSRADAGVVRDRAVSPTTQLHAPAMPAVSSAAPATPAEPVLARERSSDQGAAAHSPRGGRERSQERASPPTTAGTGAGAVAGGATGSAAPQTGQRDLLVKEDNRYLHNTLTSEVFERHRSADPSTGVVDVGVEDLNDIAHMEALDEVRQWEDRIVSQHMVALQEDARLLTVESELLSQVQQGASYDIDWYVSEVDKVVRRKMEVYAGFLDELEVFKAQLRREESLSRSCQKQKVVVSTGPSAGVAPSAGTVGVAAGDSVVRDLGMLDGAPQRTPRTPRPAGVVGHALNNQ